MALYNRILMTLALTVALCTAANSAPVKYKTTGTFTDRSGAVHSWTIDDTHALYWDGSAYVPVGAVFTSKYLAVGPTEENFKADTEALEAAKSQGITDIILSAGGPITSVDPVALQKIVDYLDLNGFVYGIELNDGPVQGLSGYLVAPSYYRLEGPTIQAGGTWVWPNVDSAMYVVASKSNYAIKDIGGAMVADGKVTVSLSDPLSSNEVMVVYPHKAYSAYGDGAIGDIWGGFSEYRDRVLAFFKQIKFGSGLRFFVNPFSSTMDFTAEMTGFLPDSSGFRLGLEAYLTKRYIHEGGVNSAWGLRENLETIETAARLMPLWSAGRGLSYAYDRASATRYPVDVTVSQMWRDIVAYRDSSLQEYMNTIADTLKKQVANVPVIFNSSKYHRVYQNPYGIGGFDGLGANAYGTDESLVTDVAGPIYSLAEESAKTTWLIVPGTRPSRTNSSSAYPSEIAFATAMDYFREIGCKGYFIDGLQQLSPLDWLKKFKDKIQHGSNVDFKPTVVYFPTSPLTGGYVKRLAPNTWWLPTLRIGTTSYLGDGIGGYGLAGEDMAYLWSATGKRTITLKTPPSGNPAVVFPSGDAVGKKKGGMFSVNLTDTPTVMRPLDFSLVFPYETAQTEISILGSVIIDADKAKIEVNKARDAQQRAKDVLVKGQPMIAFGIAQSAIQELMTVMGAMVWQEGEQSIASNFDGPKSMYGASNNIALMLDRVENAPLAPYSAAYNIEVGLNSSYQMWLAGTPPSDGSTLSYSLDDGPWLPVAAEGAPQNYAPGLSWYSFGAANLTPGKHPLKFRVDGPRSRDNKYYFAIDAIVVSPREFKPNGVIKPY